jgi:protein-tyrosine phosphatase
MFVCPLFLTCPHLRLTPPPLPRPYAKTYGMHERISCAMQAEQPTSRAEVMAFVQQLFDFVEGALVAGSSVLIHCLAGAHRAGTTGCLLLMHKTGLGADQATRMAQAARPVINPIGGLPKLLRAFETDRAQ